MKSESSTYAVKNSDQSKEPFDVITVAFDDAETDLLYLTSHPDVPVPFGVNVIHGVIGSIGAISQTLNPDKALAEIGSIDAVIVDRGEAFTDYLRVKDQLGYSLHDKTLRHYAGFRGIPFADFSAWQSQKIKRLSFNPNGSYRVGCADIQRAMRDTIFEPVKTNLLATISATATVIPAAITEKFLTVEHGASYSDAPNQTVLYIKINDEVIRGQKNDITNEFINCVRGAMGTRAAVHEVDQTKSIERRPAITEYIYLEMPALKILWAVLTNELYGQGGARLPDHWGRGIDPALLVQSDFINSHPDWWDIADDTRGLIFRFDGLTKTSGKRFVEEELCFIMGAYTPIIGDGRLAFRKMAAVLPDAATATTLTPANIVDHSALDFDFSSMHNRAEVRWSWDAVNEEYTRKTLMVDWVSVGKFKASEKAYIIEARGLHASRLSDQLLQLRFDSWRDRYSVPPVRLTLSVVPSKNGLEVGDVVEVDHPGIRDFTNDTVGVKRAFEIQRVRKHAAKGALELDLFGSGGPASVMPSTSAQVSLSDSFITSRGVDIETPLVTASVGGVITVTANGTLVGGNTFGTGIFFVAGDLVIPDGVTITITGNVLLLVMGFFTLNGKINGVGGGHSGALADQPGVPGFLGNSRAGGGIVFSTGPGVGDAYDPFTSVAAPVNQGTNPGSLPVLELGYDGASLSGIEKLDARGGGGGGGYSVKNDQGALLGAGGAGGTGGAAFAASCRGMASGVNGEIDTSGTPGALGTIYNVESRAGGGAGGLPGACYILIDGATFSLPLNVLTAMRGATPIGGDPLPLVVFNFYDHYTGQVNPPYHSYYTGTPAHNMSQSAWRVQRIPALVSSEPDKPSGIIDPPTSVVPASGNAHIDTNNDGSLTAWLGLTWTATADIRAVGYEIQIRRVGDPDWLPAVFLLERATQSARLGPVLIGGTYDIRMRSRDDSRRFSDWVLPAPHLIQGKTTPPGDVPWIVAMQAGDVVLLKWGLISDVDRDGYDARFGPRGNTSWEDATPVTNDVLSRGTNITTATIPPGDWTVFIKGRNRSGVQSINAAQDNVIVTSRFDVVHKQASHPFSNGTLTGFVRHWTGVLLPDSTRAASLHTRAELFEQFVPYPVAQCIYEAPEIDIDFDDTVRIWGDIDSHLGPGVVGGVANPQFEIDFRTEADAYDGFEAWGIGNRIARYVKPRIVLNTSEGLAIVTGFVTTVDNLEDEIEMTVDVAPSGTDIVFSRAWHVIPHIEPQYIGPNDYRPGIDNITTTGCRVYLWNAGASIAGTVKLKIRSV